MDKNLIWKIGLIVLLVGLAVLQLYPPQDNLKLGLDLAGGTSLIYDIDTLDLDASERKGLSQRMIPILLNLRFNYNAPLKFALLIYCHKSVIFDPFRGPFVKRIILDPFGN